MRGMGKKNNQLYPDKQGFDEDLALILSQSQTEALYTDSATPCMTKGCRNVAIRGLRHCKTCQFERSRAVQNAARIARLCE